MRFNKTRVVSSDVGRYAKKDTGTESAPQKHSSVMSTTRVSSGGVASHPVTGKKQSAKMKGTRVK